MWVFVTIKKVGMMINVDANAKNWLTVVCDEEYIWNPSNCEC